MTKSFFLQLHFMFHDKEDYGGYFVISIDNRIVIFVSFDKLTIFIESSGRCISVYLHNDGGM